MRAFRICSEEYLDAEINHVFEVFMNLRYPKAFIVRCLHRAKRIRRSPTSSKVLPNKIIVAPSCSKTECITRVLKKSNVQLIEKAGLKIGELVKKKKNAKKKQENTNSVVYKVPCGGCSKVYIGETYRGFKKRLSEHKADIRCHKPTSSFVMHINDKQHLPDWGKTEILWSGGEKKRRKAVEAALIEVLPNINSKRGDYSLSPIVARIMWSEHVQGT